MNIKCKTINPKIKEMKIWIKTPFIAWTPKRAECGDVVVVVFVVVVLIASAQPKKSTNSNHFTGQFCTYRYHTTYPIYLYIFDKCVCMNVWVCELKTFTSLPAVWISCATHYPSIHPSIDKQAHFNASTDVLYSYLQNHTSILTCSCRKI